MYLLHSFCMKATAATCHVPCACSRGVTSPGRRWFLRTLQMAKRRCRHRTCYLSIRGQGCLFVGTCMHAIAHIHALVINIWAVAWPMGCLYMQNCCAAADCGTLAAAGHQQIRDASGASGHP